MKETTDYLDNIVGIVHAARKKNKKIGARLKHFYLNKEKIRVELTGRGYLTIDVAYAKDGAAQLSKEIILTISETFEVK
jgi:hypothetical protein